MCGVKMITATEELRVMVREAERQITLVIDQQISILRKAGLSVTSIDVPLIDAASNGRPFDTVPGMTRIKVTL